MLAEGTGSMMIIMSEKTIKIWDVEFGELKCSYETKERII